MDGLVLLILGIGILGGLDLLVLRFGADSRVRETDTRRPARPVALSGH
jgi:hypothetical protein